MKVIFLDIDGVLNVIPTKFDKWGAYFGPDDHFVKNLKRIIDETGAKIVITSTWRMSGLQNMLDMWKGRNLPGEVVGITPNHMMKTGTTLQRGKEIDEWISLSKEVENYVIIDDDNDMEQHQRKNFVRTFKNIKDEDCVDLGYGLTNNCTKKAIEILNRK
jgi:hypothetical protein